MMRIVNKIEKRCKYYLGRIMHRNINDIDTTLDLLLQNDISISRFGDGEFSLIIGESIRFQEFDKDLACRLKEIIENGSDEQCIVCVPYALISLNNYNDISRNFWKDYLRVNLFTWKMLMNRKKQYYATETNRPFKDFYDRSSCASVIEKWKEIWRKKKIVIVESRSAKMGFWNDLFEECISVKRILMPGRDAWSYYNKLIEYIMNNVPKDDMILISLGPTATVLAYDLSREGYVALDIGHIDGEYEMLLKYGSKSKKMVSELEVEENQKRNINDDREFEYEQSIIYEIK